MNEITNKDKTNDLKDIIRPLNHRQKEFARIRATEPHLTNAQVMDKAGYKANNAHTASQMATELLKKPDVQLEMSKWSSEAENTVYQVMKLATDQMNDEQVRDNNRVAWANTAKDSADSILDRVHGKSKQSIDVQSKSVSINVDLTMSELLTD